MKHNNVVKALLIVFSVVLLVSCAWHTAQLIETNDAGDALGPHIVYDAAGNAIAVWTQSDGTRFNIWANRFF